MPGTAGKFLKGGRWDRYIGKAVSVAEDGRSETFLGDDGTVQKLDGPATVVPVKPGLVVPAPRPPAAPLPTAAKIAPDDAPPALVVPPPATRPRVVPETPAVDETPDVTAGKLSASEPAAPVEQHMGRGRAFLMAALNALGPATQQAQANANARGGGVHLSDVGAALVGAGAAGAVGAVSPRTVEYMQHERQKAKAEADRARQMAFDLEQAKINQTNANANLLTRRPEIEAAKAEAAHTARQQSMIRAEIGTRLKSPRPFDPSNAYDADLLARSGAVGVTFDPSAFGDMKNPATLQILDPTDPSGTRKTLVRYNRQSGEFEPVTMQMQVPPPRPRVVPPPDATPAPAATSGLIVPPPPVRQNVTTGYVQPVGVDGMTPAQRAGMTDRRAGQTETKRFHDIQAGQGAARITQGAERLGLARDNQTLRGTPTATATNARLARAAELQRKLDDEKNRAAHPPRFNPATNQEMTPEQQQAYTARHKQAAAGYRDQIANAFGDIYETGEDGDGWAYAKPKVQPNARAAAAGGGYTEEDVRARARAAGKDEDAAVRAARAAKLIP
jgi:hypothetical protein